MIKVIDSHAHYDDEAFDGDRFTLLDSLFQSSVERIVNIGCTLKSSEKSLELAARYQGMHAAVGIHPENTGSLPDDYLDRLREMSKSPKTVAIGEIGLDFHREEHDRETQRLRFREQLSLANELHLPVIIHSREATRETLEILNEFRPKGVVHCFSGSPEMAREILKLGMMIGFTGVLTFKNAKKAAESCKIIPIERMLLETDAPYMAPVPYRGKRCHSGMIYETAKKAAELKGMETEKVLQICNDNAIRLFGL